MAVGDPQKKNASQRATNEKKRSAHAHSLAIRFRRNWIVEKLRKFICAKNIQRRRWREREEERERRNCSYIISSSHMKCWKLVQWPAHTEKLRCRNITKRSGLSEVSYTKQHTKKKLCFICENRKLWFGLLVIDDTTNKRRRRRTPSSLRSLAAFFLPTLSTPIDLNIFVRLLLKQKTWYHGGVDVAGTKRRLASLKAHSQSYTMKIIISAGST